MDEPGVNWKEVLMAEMDSETTCLKCYAEFLEPEELENHIRLMHHETGLIQCQFCIRCLSDMHTYAIHIKDEHLNDMFWCKYCSRAFISTEELKAHEFKHGKNRRKHHLCSQCGIAFANIADLQHHEFFNHENATDGVFLQHCFSYLSSVLNTNITKFFNSDHGFTIVCAGCDYSTPYYKKFYKHQKNGKCTSYVCDKCSEPFKSKSKLIEHFHREECCGYMSLEDSKVHCKNCKSYIAQSVMNEHLKTCNAVVCPICGDLFLSVSLLAAHQLRDHPMSLELKSCSYCSKDFVSKSALKKHMERSHISKLHLYKYKCVHCGLKFLHPKNLFAHFFSHHKSLEPYTCIICDKKFRLRKPFSIHIKLVHKSVGFVETDENFNVYFTEVRSKNTSNNTSSATLEFSGDEDLDANKKDDNNKISDKSDEMIGNIQNNDKDTSEGHDNSIKSRIDENKDNTDLEEDETEATGKENDDQQITKKKDSDEGKTYIEIIDYSSDYIEAMEAEEKKKKKTQRMSKRKQKLKPRNPEDSSDDESLMLLRKQSWKTGKNRPTHLRNRLKNKRNQFTCKICHKYCYTFQNYHNHVKMHNNKETKHCIKCSKIFKDSESLIEHLKGDHATSKLTETLKKVLEQRKSNKNNSSDNSNEISKSQKFKNTIIRVNTESCNSVATVVPAQDKHISLQKFIESFTPDLDKSKEGNNHQFKLTRYLGPERPCLIKMKKCISEPVDKESLGKLAMPVKFKEPNMDKPQVGIKLVQGVSRLPSILMQKVVNTDGYNNNDVTLYDDSKSIPDVAEEVLLEGSEEPRAVYESNKSQYAKNYQDVFVAHLLPQQPFYEIVTVREVNKKKEEQQEEPKDEVIKLGNGTKLVAANPLAHLLDQVSMEQIFEKFKNKHYKPKPRNIKGLLTKALENLSDITPMKRRFS